MKIGLVVLAVLVALPALPQETRYSYRAWGTVVGADNKGIRDIRIFVVPAVRPINGRLPTTKTGAEGSFDITFNDIPDKYIVCASNKDSPFILKKDPTHRVVCSETIELPAHDESRRIDLKFD